MTKKEYLEKIENLIVNRLKYHAPKLTSESIDLSLLDAYGIDPVYPVFIFKKPLDSNFYKAFYNVKKRIKFNLILLGEIFVKDQKLSKLDMTYVIDKAEIGSELYNTLNELNINYYSTSTFNKQDNELYVKINGKKLVYDYLPYFFNKKIMDNGVITESKCFLLNGKNFLITLSNTKNYARDVEVEINIPLPRGYYYFKKGLNFVQIKNLTSNEKAYFNYFVNNYELYFSNVDGIESCSFACVHLKSKIKLLAKEIKSIFFNFGDEKFVLTNKKDMQNFFDFSQNKMNEIFDVKVTSHDKKFDELFNLSLPRKIWEKWQNFDYDEKSENEWLKFKNNLLKNSDNGIQINGEFEGLKEVKFFRNQRWKRVFVIHNGACYLYADKIKYFNYTLLTKEIFDKNNEIYLSFNS